MQAVSVGSASSNNGIVPATRHGDSAMSKIKFHPMKSEEFFDPASSRKIKYFARNLEAARSIHLFESEQWLVQKLAQMLCDGKCKEVGDSSTMWNVANPTIGIAGVIEEITNDGANITLGLYKVPRRANVIAPSQHEMNCFRKCISAHPDPTRSMRAVLAQLWTSTQDPETLCSEGKSAILQEYADGSRLIIQVVYPNGDTPTLGALVVYADGSFHSPSQIKAVA